MEAAAEILAAVPGIEMVISTSRRSADEQCAARPAGVQAHAAARRAGAARDAGIDALGRGLSPRPSRAVRPRARFSVPDRQSAGDRRRQHGLEPGGPVQAASRSCRTSSSSCRKPATSAACTTSTRRPPARRSRPCSTSSRCRCKARATMAPRAGTPRLHQRLIPPQR